MDAADWSAKIYCKQTSTDTKYSRQKIQSVQRKTACNSFKKKIDINRHHPSHLGWNECLNKTNGNDTKQSNSISPPTRSILGKVRDIRGRHRYPSSRHCTNRLRKKRLEKQSMKCPNQITSHPPSCHLTSQTIPRGNELPCSPPQAQPPSLIQQDRRQTPRWYPGCCHHQ